MPPATVMLHTLTQCTLTMRNDRSPDNAAGADPWRQQDTQQRRPAEGWHSWQATSLRGSAQHTKRLPRVRTGLPLVWVGSENACCDAPDHTPPRTTPARSPTRTDEGTTDGGAALELYSHLGFEEHERKCEKGAPRPSTHFFKEHAMARGHVSRVVASSRTACHAHDVSTKAAARRRGIQGACWRLGGGPRADRQRRHALLSAPRCSTR